jgi:beta-glucanase (GH16 family)
VERDKDGFMTVGLLWTPGSAIYYCNGKEVLRWEDPRIACVPEHFIIEMTTGGWDNDKVDESKLPADYSIDYVRVWQRKDLASAADSPPNLNK